MDPRDAWDSQATDPRRPLWDADPEAKRRRLEGWASGQAEAAGTVALNAWPAAIAGTSWSPAGLQGPSGAPTSPEALVGGLPVQAGWGAWGAAAVHAGQSVPGMPLAEHAQTVLQPVAPGYFHTGVPAQPMGNDITSRIVSALKHHMPNGHQGALQQHSVQLMPGHFRTLVPESDLSVRLLDSLRTLMPTGDYGSLAGQELFRVMQNLGPHSQPLQVGMPQFVKVELDSEVSGHGVVDATAFQPSSLAFRAVPFGERAPREEDIESDEDVPHRLPPGFGAIPEDLVEERARQREEERVLRLKATQPCRFGRRCKRRDCPNAHPEGRDIDTSLNPCAFGRRCKRKGCFYDHPEGRLIDDDPTKGMCKFAARCSRPDCLYDHPEGRVALVGPDPRICYFCHDSGHIATDCPRNPDSWNFNREAKADQMSVPAEQKALTEGV